MDQARITVSTESRPQPGQWLLAQTNGRYFLRLLECPVAFLGGLVAMLSEDLLAEAFVSGDSEVRSKPSSSLSELVQPATSVASSHPGPSRYAWPMAESI
jgi:hypothetical protein